MELHQLMEMGEAVTTTTPVRDEPTGDPMWDDLCKAEDQYQEVARALGCRTFFHEDVLARARELRKFWERG